MSLLPAVTVRCRTCGAPIAQVFHSDSGAELRRIPPATSSPLAAEPLRVPIDCARCDAPRWVSRSKLVAEAEAFARGGTTSTQRAFGRAVRTESTVIR